MSTDEIRYYSRHDRFPVAVDCIIFSLEKGGLKVLLAPRRFEPQMGVMSLMGGFVRKEETIDESAARVLSTLTGLDNIYMEQVGAFGALDRDPGDRVISIAYYALISRDEEIDSRIALHNAQWTDVDDLPQLFFDHELMIRSARAVMRRKALSEPICFHLLPEHFTLAQLQTLYEAILCESLDKRNFRRRILEIPCIERTEIIDKKSSRRGAAMFRFNPQIYETSKFKL